MAKRESTPSPALTHCQPPRHPRRPLNRQHPAGRTGLASPAVILLPEPPWRGWNPLSRMQPAAPRHPLRIHPARSPRSWQRRQMQQSSAVPVGAPGTVLTCRAWKGAAGTGCCPRGRQRGWTRRVEAPRWKSEREAAKGRSGTTLSPRTRILRSRAERMAKGWQRAPERTAWRSRLLAGARLVQRCPSPASARGQGSHPRPPPPAPVPPRRAALSAR